MEVQFSWNILVVEDDVDLFSMMERELQRETTMRDMSIQVIHAVTLADARQKWRAYRPDAISTDMSFPLLLNGKIHRNAGAHFAHFLKRESKTHYLIYSGYDENDSKEMLAELDIDPFPNIIQKDYSRGHTKWAKAMVDLLFER